MDVYDRAKRGYIQRLKEQIAIINAIIKFNKEIWAMYEDGLLTQYEWLELFEMAGGNDNG